MNENESYIFCVEQPTKWSIKPEQFWITGWFLSKTGLRYVDVRAFIDDVPFMGFLGLPRRDIEAAYPQYTRDQHPGFAFRLDPWPGAKWIRLEILNQHNDWAEFWRVPIRCKGQGPGKRLHARLQPELVKPMLLELLKQPTFLPDLKRPGHARRLVRERSVIPLEALPVPPLYGVFEGPHVIAHTQYDKLHIGGWIFHAEQPIQQLIATTDNRTQNYLVHGIEREDVPKLFPNIPAARYPQFRGNVDLPANIAEPVCLKIFAVLENGEKILAFTKRLYPWTSLEKEHPLPPYSFANYREVVLAVLSACRSLKVRTGGLSFWRSVLEVHRLYRDESQEPMPWFGWQRRGDYESWLAHNSVAPRLLEVFKESAARLQNGGAEFALVVDAHGAAPGHLARLLDSLRVQIYGRWSLAFVQPHDASPEFTAELQQLAKSDLRVRVVVAADANRAAALNTAAHTLGEPWLAFLETDGRLAPTALLFVAEAIARSPETELVFTDEDRMTDAGARSDPRFKCAWNPALVLSTEQPGNLLVMHRKLFMRSGEFMPDYAPALIFDLVLRVAENVPAAQVQHVDAICYHAPSPEPKIAAGSPLVEQTRHALEAAIVRRKLPARAFQPGFVHQLARSHHQLYWDSTYLSQHHVTIVIPTRDRADLLERCLEALLLTVDWRFVKLIIVDDFSRDDKTVRLLRLLPSRREFNCRVVRPAVDPMKPFNYSLLVNTALPYVDTPLVLHLNNDVDALRHGWIEAMAGWFAMPDVGVVGAKLLFPNNHLNHAGVIVGPHHGLADVPLAGLKSDTDDFYELHKLARDVTSVTGACMMTRTSLYRELGGFDEVDFRVTYNDVDYCLRARDAGYRVVYTPQAELWHWGSASRGTTYYENEHVAFLRKYPGITDPHFPRQYYLITGWLNLETYRYEYASRLGRLHLMLVTHNLNYEGAPLFLLEYAKHMVQVEGFQVDLVTAEDGPLRGAYEALGIKITQVDRHPLHGARDDQEFAEQVRLLRDKLDFTGVDVVLCNTVACWWGVHVAAAAGKPSMLYVHESASIKRFFSKMLHKHMHHVARAAFRQATRGCFLCQSSRGYFEEFNDYDNFRFVSSWIDLPRIEAFKRTHSKAALRRKYGYADDETIIANIGTVCERKGQHIFIRTIDLFMREYARGGKYRFLFVGGRPGEYQDSLIRDMQMLGINNVDIITETRDAYDFFVLSDMFVCTSYEESFPRVLLEAMAFEIPIVSTEVNGVPEMVTHRAEANLVDAGDPVEFAKTMKACLEKQLNGTSTAPMGYSKVVRAYDIARVLPKHADMAREAVLDFDGNTRRAQPNRLSGRGDRTESSW
jgi:glycosyltransferase involved in cell wall biosynthesis/GT2 family glycosyltransferase